MAGEDEASFAAGTAQGADDKHKKDTALPLRAHHPRDKSSSLRWDQRDGWRQGAKEKAYKCTKEKQSLNRQRKRDRPSQKEGAASPRAQMSGKGWSIIQGGWNTGTRRPGGNDLRVGARLTIARQYLKQW